MRFKSYLDERIEDTEETKLDVGKKGKKFENTLLNAFKLTGLDFEANRGSGAIWDVKPKGTGWNKLISAKDVNIKIHRTKWLFGTSELYKLLPWDNIGEDFDKEKAAKKIKSLFRKKGVESTFFLKPKSNEIESAIIDAVKSKDKEKLDKLLIKKNFLIEKLGRNYSIRILTKNNRISSIAVDKGGKVFMRSEAPRQYGKTGSIMITFRSPKPSIGKTKRKVKLSEEYVTRVKGYEIFVNPSRRELRDLGDGIRFIADPRKKEVYVFNWGLIHWDVFKNLIGNWNSRRFNYLLGTAEQEGNEYIMYEVDEITGCGPSILPKWIPILKQNWDWLKRYHIDADKWFSRWTSEFIKKFKQMGLKKEKYKELSQLGSMEE